MVGLLVARPDVRRDVEISRGVGLGLSQFERLPREDRELLRAEWLTRQRICSQHGGDLAECSHEVWHEQRTICRPAMAQAWVEWKYDQAHEELPYHDGSFENWVAERSDAFPFHYRDGVQLWVSQDDLSPDDDFLTPPERFKPSSVDYPEGR